MPRSIPHGLPRLEAASWPAARVGPRSQLNRDLAIVVDGSDLAQPGPGVPAENGYVRIVGRRRATTTRSGFRIHQREEADLLRSYPVVHDVRVIGVPHDVLGEPVCARIELSPISPVHR